MSDVQTTLLDDLQADIDARADAAVREGIAAGTPINAWTLAGQIIGWWHEAGVDVLGPSGVHREQSRRCQSRIDELRREATPEPVAPTNQYPKTDEGLLGAAQHVEFELCECIGEPMIRLPGGEFGGSPAVGAPTCARGCSTRSSAGERWRYTRQQGARLK